MSVNIENVISKLRSLNQSKFDLLTLEKLFQVSSYDDLLYLIAQLEQLKIISPIIASKQNGLNPPLYKKYRILPQKTDNSSVLQEIDSLHYRINTEQLRKNPDRYVQNREILYPLSEFLKNHSETLCSPMSENERAYEIWGNEKILDKKEHIALLKKCGIWEHLNTYPTPEPFFEYRRISAPANVLVIENKDSWFTMRKLMLEYGTYCFFDTPVDCLLYGEGNKITNKASSLEEYLNLDRVFDGTVFYWGDLDPEGIGFFLAVRELNTTLKIQPFLPAYREMLRLFEQRLGQVHDKNMYRIRKQQKYPAHSEEFYSCFPENTAARLQMLMENGYYIPQEILNYQILKSHSR